jgi:hypothetical protein
MWPSTVKAWRRSPTRSRSAPPAVRRRVGEIAAPLDHDADPVVGHEALEGPMGASSIAP